MESNFNITKKNFLLYAMHKYNSPCINSFDEFVLDIRKISLVLRLMRKYQRNDVVNIHLLINHIISLHNVFSTEALCKILFFKIPEDLYPQLKTCLIFLGYLPEIVFGVNGVNIKTVNIALDQKIVGMLREI